MSAQGEATTAVLEVLGAAVAAGLDGQGIAGTLFHLRGLIDILGDEAARASEPDSESWAASEAVIATIPVGDHAGDIVVSPDSKYVYVANSNSLNVIDSSNTIVATIPIAGEPKAMAIDADGTRVYVTSYGGSASVIDTADYTVRSVPAGGSVQAVSPNGGYIYAAHHARVAAGYDSWISVINTEGTTVATVPVDNYVTDLAIGHDGSRVFAATVDRASYYQYPEGWLWVIDTATHTVVDTITTGRSPNAITVGPDGSVVYVTHHDTCSVSAVDLATRTVTPIALDEAPLTATLSPDGDQAFVTTAHTLSIVDTATNTAQAVAIGGMPRGVQFGADGKRAYVTNHGDHTVSVIDTITNAVVGTLDVGGHPETMAVSPDGAHLYVTDYWAGTVTVVAIP
jgi:YVTN family beta-propeller protein